MSNQAKTIQEWVGTAVKVIEVPGWRPDAHHRLGDMGKIVGLGSPMAEFRVEFPDGEQHNYASFEIDEV